MERTACHYRAGVSRVPTSLHDVLMQTVTVRRQFCITTQNSDLWQGTQCRLAITDVSVKRFRLLAMDVRNVGAIYKSQRHSYICLKPHMVLTGLQQWTPLL